jgi:hypothetical protein
MPDIEPINKYVAAVEDVKKGWVGSASVLLAQAMGVEKPSAVIRGSVERLLKQGTPANEVALRIVANEVARRKKKA